MNKINQYIQNCLGNYKINTDGSYDVFNDVSLGAPYFYKFFEIPIKFNIIYGSFDISYSKLKTLNNFANTIYGDCYLNGLKFNRAININIVNGVAGDLVYTDDNYKWIF